MDIFLHGGYVETVVLITKVKNRKLKKVENKRFCLPC